MALFNPNIERAISVAAWAHDQQGQYRKGSEIPYIVHPIGVMLLASEVTLDEDTLVASVLHDVPEDVSEDIYSRQQLYDDFGNGVYWIVEAVTKDKTIKNWRACNQRYVQKLEHNPSDKPLIVCAADKVFNLSNTVQEHKLVGPAVWQKFTTKSVEDQVWYYGEVHAMLERRLPDMPLTRRLGGLLVELTEDLSVY